MKNITYALGILFISSLAFGDFEARILGTAMSNARASVPAPRVAARPAPRNSKPVQRKDAARVAVQSSKHVPSANTASRPHESVKKEKQLMAKYETNKKMMTKHR